jgi:hypothetical protein
MPRKGTDCHLQVYRLALAGRGKNFSLHNIAMNQICLFIIEAFLFLTVNKKTMGMWCDVIYRKISRLISRALTGKLYEKRVSMCIHVDNKKSGREYVWGMKIA